jgi:hypothetical protein
MRSGTFHGTIYFLLSSILGVTRTRCNLQHNKYSIYTLHTSSATKVLNLVRDIAENKMAEPLSPNEANNPNSLINPETAAYTWEEQYTRTWDSLQEDEHGSLQTLVAQRRQQAKKRK